MTLRLEDRGSGELFAACPVEQFPGKGPVPGPKTSDLLSLFIVFLLGMSVEPVTDSSRYFVICIKVR